MTSARAGSLPRVPARLDTWRVWRHSLLRLSPEPVPSPIARSCVTRNRARSKLLDQDSERSDASRRVNSLIFTLGAPAGD